LRRKFDRKHLITFLANFPSCTIVMEACAGAHWMARQLSALGHEAKLISPQFVRPFVKGNKNDFIDAEAICEAASRPSMRFVTPKTEAQQCLSALHWTRESLMRERVKAINQVHGFLLEFGIGLPKGPAIIQRLPSVLAERALPARLVSLIERLRRCNPEAAGAGLRSGKTALPGTLVGCDKELEIDGRGVAQSGTGCT
jgi:transposase